MNRQGKHDGLLLVVSGSYLHPSTTYFEWWSEEYSYQDTCLIVSINFVKTENAQARSIAVSNVTSGTCSAS